jgi:hypothetical protein
VRVDGKCVISPGKNRNILFPAPPEFLQAHFQRIVATDGILLTQPTRQIERFVTLQGWQIEVHNPLGFLLR